MELLPPHLLITAGFLAFASVNFLTRFITPRAARQTAKQKWKWWGLNKMTTNKYLRLNLTCITRKSTHKHIVCRRNVATSLVHSVVTGIWAPICFVQVRPTS